MQSVCILYHTVVMVTSSPFLNRWWQESTPLHRSGMKLGKPKDLLDAGRLVEFTLANHLFIFPIMLF